MPGNIDNLRPYKPGQLTSAEAKERGRNGGLANGRTIKRRKTMREQAKVLLNLPIPDKDKLNLLKSLGCDNPTVMDEILYAQYLKAKDKQDTEAAKFIRDTSGEKPAQAVELSETDPDKVGKDELENLSDEDLRKLSENAEDQG